MAIAASRPRGWVSQQGRLALWTPVLAGTGAAIYFLLKTEPGQAWGVMAGGAALACLLLAGAVPRARWPLLAACWLAAGFAGAMLRTDQMAAPVLREPTRAITVSGQVIDSYIAQDGKARVMLRIGALTGVPETDTPAAVRIALRKADGLPEPGTWISVRARLSPLPTPVTPGSYDFARAMWFNGIGANGFAMAAPQPAEARAPPGWWDEVNLRTAALRYQMSARIRAALPGSTGAIAAALTVGDRSQIDEKDNQAFRDSSLAHILSISGVHMVIVGVGFFSMLRFLAALVPALALRFNTKKWAAGAALILTYFYLMLSGASVPAERSFIMIALAFAAIMLDRQPYSLRVVALSALYILLTAPENVFDPSFQMSFAAVTALIATFEAFDAWQVRRGGPLVLRDTWTGRALNTLLLAVLTSMVAGAATAPYAAYHFNRVAAYGVAANMMAMPLVSFIIMPFCVLTILAMPFGLEWYPAQVAGWGIDGMRWVAAETASWPGAASAVASMPDAALALMTLGGLCLCLFRGRLRLVGLAPFAVSALLIALAAPPDILIDRNAGNVAVRGADGQLALVSGRRGRFASEEWLQRDGDAGEVKDAAKRGRAGVWRCADHLCRASVNGVSIGFMERAGDEKAACTGGFALLVAAREIAACSEGLTITPADTAMNGAYAVRVVDSQLEIKTVRDTVGERPWTVWPKGPLPVP